KRRNTSGLGHDHVPRTQSFVQSQKSVSVMGSRSDHRKDGQVAMANWIEHLISGRGDLATSNQARYKRGQCGQNQHKNDDKPQLVAHDLLLSKHTPTSAQHMALSQWLRVRPQSLLT